MPRKKVEQVGGEVIFPVGILIVACLVGLALPHPDNCFPGCSRSHYYWSSVEGYRQHEDTYKCYLNITRGCESINELLHKKISQGLRILKQTSALDLTCEGVTSSLGVNWTEIGALMPAIRTITISRCNISKEGFYGTLPPTVQTLNLSYNALDSLPESLFDYKTDEGDNNGAELATLDLRGNSNLTSLPKSLLQLRSIRKIWLGSNRLRCSWIVEFLYPLYTRNNHIFVDASKLNCASAYNLSLTIQGALRAKQAEETECRITPHCSCRIYVFHLKKNQKDDLPVSFTDRGENISITLDVDCSSRNLTRLPTISPHTKVLNVSNNQIRGLDELARSEYRNLRQLVAEQNLIENFNSIKGTEFAKHFDILNLAHNSITRLSRDDMSIVLNTDVKGHGRISLGRNSVHCECETFKVLLLFLKHKQRVDGIESISCQNLPKKLVDLREEHLCKREEEDSGLAWAIVITVEVCLILVVLAKVFYDSRQYRQTGILPWCSDKMPRLPCDFMLEGLKGPRVER